MAMTDTNNHAPHMVWKEQGNKPREYFFGVDWEITAFCMDDLKGSPTKLEAVEAYKDRKANKYMELMESIWTDT